MVAVNVGGGASQVSGFRCFQMRMCWVSIPGCGVTSLVAVVFLKVSTDFRFEVSVVSGELPHQYLWFQGFHSLSLQGLCTGRCSDLEGSVL